MTEGIIIALITGVLALLGTVISGRNAANKVAETMMSNMEKAQAVTDTKLEELTREVRAHNNFAQRVPVMEEQIKGINHRIEDLEGFHKPQ